MPLVWKRGTLEVGDEEHEYTWLAGGSPILDKEEVNTGRQDTLLVAKINGHYLGKFQSGLYGQHAEESMLEELRKLWGDMLEEGVVWRPTHEQPINVLSIHLTRSPCGPSLNDCAQQIIDFVREMNRKTEGTRYNRWGVNWNLRVRLKFRRIYGRNDTDKLESKKSLKKLWKEGVALRAWEVLDKADTTFTKHGGVHELAIVKKSYFSKKERTTSSSSSKTMAAKLKKEKQEVEEFLTEHVYPFGIKPSWDLSYSGNLKEVSARQDLHTFVMVELYQQAEQRVRSVLEQFHQQYAGQKLLMLSFQPGEQSHDAQLAQLEKLIRGHWGLVREELVKVLTQ